jgi:hypothetical protein
VVDIAAVVVIPVIYLYNLFQSKTNDNTFLTMVMFGARPEEPFSVVVRFGILFAFKAFADSVSLLLLLRRLKKENLTEKILCYVHKDFESWCLVYPLVMIVAISNGFTIYSNMLIFNDSAWNDLNLVVSVAKPKSFWQVQLQEFTLAQ